MKTLLHYLFLLCFNVLLPAVHSHCIKDQQQSLLHFKNSLQFNASYSTKLISWNSSTDCCSWVGVTCSSNGHVVGLDLSSETISSGIDNSSSLIHLQHLQTLNLADNDFENPTSIPSEIGKLVNLRYLNLSYNYYSGQIPIEISHLTKLVVLDISQSYYSSGIDAPNISILFQNLTELAGLYFDYVNLSAQGAHWSQSISSSLPNLTVLSLFGTGLSGPIDQSLTQLQSLSVIQLGGNDISGPIPGFFANFSNLRMLDLSLNSIDGPIPGSFANFSNLRVLDLSSNNIDGPIPGFFANFSNLRVLDLSSNNIDGPIPGFFANFSNLRVLDLSSNNIDGPIPGSFANISNLRVLDLSYNRISGTVPGFFANFSKLNSLSLHACRLQGTFPKEIFQVPTLQTIDLSGNEELHGSLPEFPKNNGSLGSLFLSWTNFSGSLPDSIANLKMLSMIDLSDCSFHGSIPKSLANLTQLHYLYMSSNMFEGSIPSSLFSLPLLSKLILSHNHFSGKLAFSNVSSYLYFLDLRFNKLEGSIPTSIFNFQSLQFLYLSSNNFSGFLFSGPQQLRNLKEIDLSYNHLLIFSNGSYSPFPKLKKLDFASNNLTTFPDFLRNQSTLYHLDLSENHIGGQIPHWIWSSLGEIATLNLSCNSLVTLEAPLLNSSVQTVDLHSNQLQGQIPTFLVRFATYLDNSRNKFRSIPSNIGDFLEGTKFFSLSSNNLDGLIPVSLCNASKLQILDLSNNSLSGMIPQCLTAIDALGILNLARNNLTGTVSNLEVAEDSSLEMLELGGNQLGGQFPKSLGNCTQLQILNLGNNNITDSFPCLLNDISTLRVLVLRSNNFYGGIECLNTNGTALQIIDLAHNNFSGEIQGILWRTSVPEDSKTETSARTCGRTQYVACTQYRKESKNRLSIKYSLSITFTNKGSERDYMVKILYILTLIDFSCNNFSGPIPKEIGGFESLKVLNLSRNAFTGKISSSFGNMKDLESLDLSQNKLSGQIPPELANLTSLSFLNLSNNQLVGRIPISTQFSTFPKDSFTGNKGLWGPPLTVDTRLSPPPALNGSLPNSGHHGINWDLINVEIGFTFGFGVSIGSLVLCKRWSKWYYRAMYQMVLKIFPQLEERIGIHRRHVHINRRWRR